MFPLIRKYASVLALVCMSAFAVCLLADEWHDLQRAWQDLEIEAMAELETEDFEWNEANATYQVAARSDLRQLAPCIVIPCMGRHELDSSPCISDKQKLGLVRRFAPNSAVRSYNYTRILTKRYELI